MDSVYLAIVLAPLLAAAAAGLLGKKIGRAGAHWVTIIGVAVALIVVVEIGHVIWFRSQGLAFATTPKPTPEGYSNTKELGAVLYTQHVYAFEIASVILLLAIVAAITLTMRPRRGLKVQNVAKQVAVRREDRVRIVKVETSTER